MALVMTFLHSPPSTESTSPRWNVPHLPSAMAMGGSWKPFGKPACVSYKYYITVMLGRITMEIGKPALRQ